ncbi:hypothetical protein WP50_20025, partial [Lactiplantibacillus plantarum]
MRIYLTVACFKARYRRHYGQSTRLTCGRPINLSRYEALFEQLHIPFDPAKPNSEKCNQTILIINGAGGVGSIATQLAKLAG